MSCGPYRKRCITDTSFRIDLNKSRVKRGVVIGGSTMQDILDRGVASKTHLPRTQAALRILKPLTLAFLLSTTATQVFAQSATPGATMTLAPINVEDTQGTPGAPGQGVPAQGLSTSTAALRERLNALPGGRRADHRGGNADHGQPHAVQGPEHGARRRGAGLLRRQRPAARPDPRLRPAAETRSKAASWCCRTACPSTAPTAPTSSVSPTRGRPSRSRSIAATWPTASAPPCSAAPSTSPPPPAPIRPASRPRSAAAATASSTCSARPAAGRTMSTP